MTGLLKSMAVEFDAKSAPWGRTWRNSIGKCTPETAGSVLFHLRMASTKVQDLLKVSGHKGVYLAAKTEDKKVDPQFAVLLLEMPLSELKVAAASLKSSLGLVRSSRGHGSKVSRGIRCRSEDFAELLFRCQQEHTFIP